MLHVVLKRLAINVADPGADRDLACPPIAASETNEWRNVCRWPRRPSFFQHPLEIVEQPPLANLAGLAAPVSRE